MTNTPNKGYKAPTILETTDVVSDLAFNFTKIDTDMKANEDAINTHKNNANAHTSQNISHSDGSVASTLDNHETRISQNVTNINTLVLPAISELTERADATDTNISTMSEDVDYQSTRISDIESGANKTNISMIKGSTVGLSTGLDTKLIFNTLSKDTQTEVNLTTSEITIKGTGLYIISGSAVFSSALAGNSFIRIYKNGSFWSVLSGGTGQQGLYGSKIERYNIGDKITFYVQQNSGATATLTSALIDVARIF